MSNNPYYYPYNTYPTHARTPEWHLSRGASIAVLTCLPITAIVFTIIGLAIGFMVGQSRAKKIINEQRIPPPPPIPPPGGGQNRGGQRPENNRTAPPAVQVPPTQAPS